MDDGDILAERLVAALFGLHPMHVESVAWVSERKDVLSTLFFMLTLLAYARYARRPTVLRYAATFGLLTLGLMCKPMLVTVPLVLLLLDYWPLGRMRLGQAAMAASGPNALSAEESGHAVEAGETHLAEAPGKLPLGLLIAEKIPMLVLVAVSAVVTYCVQRLAGSMGMLGQVPLATRLGNALFSYGQYLEKSFWPSPLAAIYPYVVRKPIDLVIVGAALAAISVAAIRLARIRPFLIVGWCWYLGTLVPVIGLVQVGVQSMADRYTYIPLIGIFIIAAWGAAEFVEDWPVRNRAVAAAVLLTACGWCTWRQVATWSSSEALYRHAVEAEPDNIVAMDGLGTVYWKEGKLDEAQRQFEAILKVRSDLEPAHRHLGLLLAVRHQPAKALEEFDEAIHARPQQPEPRRTRHGSWPPRWTPPSATGKRP